MSESSCARQHARSSIFTFSESLFPIRHPCKFHPDKSKSQPTNTKVSRQCYTDNAGLFYMLRTVLNESVTVKKTSEEDTNLNIQVHRCKLFCQSSLVRTCTCACNTEDHWEVFLTSLDDNGTQKEPWSEKNLGIESSGRDTNISSPDRTLMSTSMSVQCRMKCKNLSVKTAFDDHRGKCLVKKHVSVFGNLSWDDEWKVREEQ